MTLMPFNCIFYCGSFDIYHSGLAGSALFFVPVYIVKISTVAAFVDKKEMTKNTHLLAEIGDKKLILFTTTWRLELMGNSNQNCTKLFNNYIF